MSKPVEYGIFMPVGKGGWIRSTTAPVFPVSYAYNRQVALMAETYGLDFLLAMAKWRGLGGPSQHWGETLESITLMSAIAEATQRIKVIPTVHTLAFNVGIVAKMLVTLDQISEGRSGLNIVSGWYTQELSQMGLWPQDISHGERYQLAREWVQALKLLWTKEEVTFQGQFIQLDKCLSDPKPLQKPRPPLICAGSSDVGLKFTIEEADAVFLLGATHAETAHHSLRAKKMAHDLGRSTRTYAMVMIIPGETDSAALARMEAYNQGVDMVAKTAALEDHRRDIERAQVLGENINNSMMQARIDRAKTPDPYVPGYPYVGSAKSIAQQLREVIQTGDLDGVMLTFPDFIEDLRCFGEQVLPLLADMGLAQPKLSAIGGA